MRFADTFKLTTPSDREIEVTRTFDTPRKSILQDPGLAARAR